MNYSQQMELQDDEWFSFFNDSMKWFEPEDYDDPLDCDIIDKYMWDRKGRMCAIEIKTRYCQINSFNGIFIEEKKYDRLMKDYKERGFIPLYINFFQDKHHVCIWDLRQYFDGRPPEKSLCTINNYGYGRTDQEYRYSLPQRDGHFYVFNKNKSIYEKRW